jgi:hypothetical protein
MKRRALWVGLGALGLAYGAAFVACSSNGDGQDAGVDQSTPDATKDVGTQDSTTKDVAADTTNDTSTDAPQACTVYDASMLDDASVAAGFTQVWKVYRCYTCHQKASQTVDEAGVGIVLSGNNNGLGDSGTIFPPNLTNEPTTGLGCWTDQQIMDAITQGKDPDGGALCPSMPVWGNALKTADGGPRAGTPMDAGTAQEIIDFMRSLPPVVNAVPDTTCASSDAGPSDAGDGGG